MLYETGLKILEYLKQLLYGAISQGYRITKHKGRIQ
jgi:hypothetical protein